MGGRLPVRGDLADAFWRELLGRVEEMLDARQMTMGEVKGRDGGKVRVRLDDEGEDRTLGFPRGLGVAYQDGDRVAIGYTRAGEPMVLGVMSAGNGDGRVRNEQLDTDAVDERAIKPRTVKGAHLDQTLEKKIADAATTEQLENRTRNLATENQLNAKADRSELGDKADKTEVEDLKKKIKELETRINRASKRSDKGKRK